MQGAWAPTTFIDRPRMAMENLVRGDVHGATEAMLDPDQLSPYQRGLTDDQGNWKPKGNGVMTQVLNTVTNPLVLMGLVLASKWPIGKAAEMINWAKKADEVSHIPMWVAKVLPFGRVYGGMAVKSHVYDYLDVVKDFREKLWQTLSKGVVEGNAAAGRTLKWDDFVKASAKLDALDNPANPSWGYLRSMVRDGKYMEKYGLPTLSHVDPFIAANGEDAAIEKVISRFGVMDKADAFNAAVNKPFVTHARTMLDDAMNAQLGDPSLVGAHQDRVRRLMSYLETHGIKMFDPKTGEEFYKKVNWTDAQKAAVDEGTFGRMFEGYFPHQAASGPSAQSTGYLESMLGTTAEGLGAEKEAKALLPRRYGMIPSLQDLGALAPYMSPETMDGLATMQRLQAQNPQLWGDVKQYSLHALGVLERYSHSMAKGYGLVGKGYGKTFQEDLQLLRAMEKGGKARAQLFGESVLPVLVGNVDGAEAQYALEWGHYKNAAHSWLKSDQSQWMPQRLRGFLSGQLERPEIQGMTYKNAGGQTRPVVLRFGFGRELGEPGLEHDPELHGVVRVGRAGAHCQRVVERYAADGQVHGVAGGRVG